jgi:hypothetical protein
MRGHRKLNHPCGEGIKRLRMVRMEERAEFSDATMPQPRHRFYKVGTSDRKNVSGSRSGRCGGYRE